MLCLLSVCLMGTVVSWVGLWRQHCTPGAPHGQDSFRACQAPSSWARQPQSSFPVLSAGSGHVHLPGHHVLTWMRAWILGHWHGEGLQLAGHRPCPLAVLPPQEGRLEVLSQHVVRGLSLPPLLDQDRALPAPLSRRGEAQRAEWPPWPEPVPKAKKELGAPRQEE